MCNKKVKEIAGFFLLLYLVRGYKPLLKVTFSKFNRDLCLKNLYPAGDIRRGSQQHTSLNRLTKVEA